MRLNHNMASLNIYRTHTKVLEKQSIALNRLSSGYKINNAKDDPNGIAQSERMRMEIRGLQAAGNNNQDGVSMLQTAEGGLEGMTQMLQRVRELVVQSGSASIEESDRKNIQNEIDQMVEGMGDISDNIEFNGKKLLNKSKLDEVTASLASADKIELDMAVGSRPGESIKIPIYDMSPEKLVIKDGGALDGKSVKDVNIENGEQSINDALSIIDNAITQVGSVRSEYGALENRFTDNLDAINEMKQSIEGTDSLIRDSDMAEEIMEYTKDSILLEAGNAMMAQTNKFPQDVLRILENVKGR